ncbi:RidA family protein [Membranihabitans marinus]|nr:RidA family protein [Membranihabitans marinus]
MLKKIVNTDKAPSPVGPYNQSIVAGDMVFISGQIPLDASTGQLVSDSIESETRQVMNNIGAVLEANGLDFEAVVSCSVFVKDMEDYGKINAVYASYFQEDTAPTRALVEVARLPKDVNIEISAIAYKHR